MKVALVGLLQSGKSTLISAISGKRLPPAGSTAIEEAVVSVPDERLDWLAKLYNPKKVVHAIIDCLDVPGFNFSDEHGRAATRRLIQQIRTVDLLVLVVRAFQDASVAAYQGSVDPHRDFEILKTELLLSDLELVARRIENLEKQMKKPGRTEAHDKMEMALHKKLQETIEAEKPISTAIETDAERELVKSLGFLTLKPIVLAVNIGEDQLDKDFSFAGDFTTVQICAKLEYELSQLDADSKQEFMADMGLVESAVSKFVHSCYSAMGELSFLTTAHHEARAWPVPQGTTALEAAGKVHTDIARGFIRAETISFSDLKELGDEKAAKAAGKIRLEGKDYLVQDGDVITFRFNV